MALETQNGRAVVHGIRNNGDPITLSGFVSFTLESMRASHKFTLDEIEDELGFHKALIATNGYMEKDVTFFPDGTTRTQAEQAVVLLTPLAKVTVANMAVDLLNGDWVYVGDESIELSHKQGKMSIKLRKYDDEDQNASLTTTVSP